MSCAQDHAVAKEESSLVFSSPEIPAAASQGMTAEWHQILCPALAVSDIAL